MVILYHTGGIRLGIGFGSGWDYFEILLNHFIDSEKHSNHSIRCALSNKMAENVLINFQLTTDWDKDTC